MSSYLKAGKKTSLIKHKNQTKKHLKRFYKALHALDLVAQAMIMSGVAITENNVEEEALKHMNRPIDAMEKKILLSKVTEVYDKIGIETNKYEEGDNDRQHSKLPRGESEVGEE